MIRGDLSTREFIAFWMHDRRVLAGLTVNIWDVTGSIEHIIKSRAEVDSDRLADPDVSMDNLLNKPA